MTNQVALSAKQGKKAVLLPLVGMGVLWLAIMAANFVDLYVSDPTYDQYGNYVETDEIRASVYIVLFGIASIALTSLWGRQIAMKLASQAQGGGGIVTAARVFSMVAIIFSLVIGAIYAITAFLSALNFFSSRPVDPAPRIFNTYVPIVLATALVVFVLVRAFVNRKEDAND